MSQEKRTENKMLELTPSEAKTTLFYIEKALIDAEGLLAIGMGSRTSVNNLKSIREKLLEKKKVQQTQNEFGAYEDVEAELDK